MFELIERLRRKNDRQKKIIAFSISFFICFVIFIFWFFSIMPEFRLQQEAEKRVESIERGPSSELGGMIMDNFSLIKEQISDLIGLSKSFSSTTEYYISTTTEISTTTMTFSTTTSEEI